MRQATDAALAKPEPLGLVWIDSIYPIVTLGLKDMLKSEARVHCGQKPPPEGDPTCVLLHLDAAKDPTPEFSRLQTLAPGIPVVVFGAQDDLRLARSALRAGARGFVHFGMQPAQVVRALEVAIEGGMAFPRDLLYGLVLGEATPVEMEALTFRQSEIMKLVAEGLTNSQIAQRLFLSESTVKQHLRAAYKVLKVRNRTEAARLVRSSVGGTGA
jgi:DNA-binding NarL/FixJ family response regulator